jgi:uncharacterized repeat protein (TIGR03803 family)
MLRSRFASGRTTLFLAFLIALTTAPRSEAASKYRILHSFAGKPDGGGIFAGLTLDPKGNLYGATTGGGTYGYGTVFELMPGSGGKWTEAILHSFCKDFPHCNDGTSVWDTAALDSKGNLYDFSSAGVFQMTPGAHGWSFKVIYSEGDQGATAPNDPAGECGLLLDGKGNLYSPCFSFGQNYRGAVGELSPGARNWKERNLFDFCLHPRNGICLGGNLPQYALAWDVAGNLYGVTTEGGAHKAGVAFELEHTAGGWKEHVLHSFPASPSDGYNFFAGLALDRSGNVYGTTLQGGRIGAGTVFELSPQQDGHWKETILSDFPNAAQDGGGPAASLVVDQSRNLYGTTTGGGDRTCSCGVVFKMTAGSNGKWSYTVLHRFTGKDGYSPQASLTLDDQGNIYGTTTEGGPGGYGVVFEITP